MIDQKLYNQAIRLVYPYVPDRIRQFYSLSYLGRVSDIIHKSLRHKNIYTAFKTGNSLGGFLKNNKSKTANLYKSGVYQLQCGSCEMVYIGQTGRSFEERLKEHSRSYRLKNNKSNYATHLINCDHLFDSNFKVLHVADKGSRLNALESLEINKRKSTGTLLNDQKDLNSSPLLNLFLV